MGKLFKTKEESKFMAPRKKKTIALPLLPLRDVVVFPNMVMPLFVGREKSVLALRAAMDANKQNTWQELVKLQYRQYSLDGRRA